MGVDQPDPELPASARSSWRRRPSPSRCRDRRPSGRRGRPARRSQCGLQADACPPDGPTGSRAIEPGVVVEEREQVDLPAGDHRGRAARRRSTGRWDASASNRPNAAGDCPSGRVLSSSRAKCRCSVRCRRRGARRVLVAGSPRPARRSGRGFSRFNAAASSNTCRRSMRGSAFAGCDGDQRVEPTGPATPGSTGPGSSGTPAPSPRTDRHARSRRAGGPAAPAPGWSGHHRLPPGSAHTGTGRRREPSPAAGHRPRSLSLWHCRSPLPHPCGPPTPPVGSQSVSG